MRTPKKGEMINGFIMLIKSNLHLLIVLLFIGLICGYVAKIDRSIEIEKRKKQRNKIKPKIKK
jgi:F0F1-type ATP synthase assembly protein I